MADIDFSSLLPTDDEGDVIERMLGDLPAPPGGQAYNTRTGSVINGLFRPLALERARLLSYASEMFQQAFVAYATGEFLDARAAEVGISRGGALYATVDVSVTGTAGVVITPENTQFASAADPATGADGITFVPNETVTIPGGGTVVVTCVSTTPGTEGNISANSIDLILAAPDGITTATNPAAASGGVDAEDDDALRLAISQRLQALAGTANAAYYRSVALREPDVQAVTVDDLWAGNGTVLITLSGRTAPYVPPAVVERLQTLFDPSVKNLAHFDGDEVWSAGTSYTSAPLEGGRSLYLSATHSSGVNTVAYLNKTLDLTDYSVSTDEVSLLIKRISASGTMNGLVIAFQTMSGGSAVGSATATITAAAINAISNVTTRGALTIPISSFSTSGSFLWSSIGRISITLNHPASGTAELLLDGMRVRKTGGGILGGQVPIGIQATVRSARSYAIDVEATVTLDTGLVVGDIESTIEASINEYFRRLAPGSVIRVAEIANIIHDTRGIIDYADISLGALAVNTNITGLAPDEGPILGVLVLNTP